jgi:hypothetical protein
MKIDWLYVPETGGSHDDLPTHPHPNPSDRGNINMNTTLWYFGGLAIANAAVGVVNAARGSYWFAAFGLLMAVFCVIVMWRDTRREKELVI